MKYLTIALTILVPLAACALNSWLNIKIKFATTPAEATRATRSVLLRVVGWLSNLYMIGILVWQLTLQTPMARLSLVAILLPAFVLFHSYMLWLLGQIIDILRDYGKIASMQNDAMKDQLDLLRDVGRGLTNR